MWGPLGKSLQPKPKSHHGGAEKTDAAEVVLFCGGTDGSAEWQANGITMLLSSPQKSTALAVR